MDNSENQNPTESRSDSSDLNDLRLETAGLRQLLISLIILMIVLSGTLNLYLLRQSRTARADLVAIKPQVTQMVADYNKMNAPVINDFVQKLVDFGQKHPDFMPIVQKYGLVRAIGGTNTVAPQGLNPATAPVTAPAPVPKK